MNNQQLIQDIAAAETRGDTDEVKRLTATLMSRLINVTATEDVDGPGNGSIEVETEDSTEDVDGPTQSGTDSDSDSDSDGPDGTGGKPCDCEPGDGDSGDGEPGEVSDGDPGEGCGSSGEMDGDYADLSNTTPKLPTGNVRGHEQAQAMIESEATRLTNMFRESLDFTDNDEGAWSNGEKSGRLRSSGAVRVATDHSAPFSVRAQPKEPTRVCVVLLVDTSGSMGSCFVRRHPARGACRVAHALNTAIGEYEGIDLVTVAYGTYTDVCEPTAAGLFGSDDGNGTIGSYTEAGKAIASARSTDQYQRAVAGRDAIIGICITDGDFSHDVVSEVQAHMASNASCERWCGIVVDPDQLARRKNMMMAAFGEDNVTASTTADACGPEIARTVQKAIQFAEARRG